MYKTHQQQIVTLFFQPGNQVQIDTSMNPDSFYAPMSGYQGRVIREADHRPGFYYVRLVGRIDGLEPNPMVCFPWHMLQLVDLA